MLTFDREPATREPTVEIAHEALLGDWQRLASWIDEAREDLRHDAHAWRVPRRSGVRSGHDDPSFLLRGARLEQVGVLGRGEHRRHRTRGARLRQGERRTFEMERRGRDLVRSEREARTERRSRTRLRSLVAVFAVAALVAATLSVVATGQKVRADDQARAASARALAAAAIANLDLDPERSVLLALAAVDVTRSEDGTVLLEAEDALHRAVASSRTTMSVAGVGGEVAWSRMGQFAAEVSGQPGSVAIGDAADEV